MSHFTRIRTKLYDLTILKKSLSDLKLEWRTDDSEIQNYNGQKDQVQLVIKQKNDYDLGFKWNGTEYELVADLMFWVQSHSVLQNMAKRDYFVELIGYRI